MVGISRLIAAEEEAPMEEDEDEAEEEEDVEGTTSGRDELEAFDEAVEDWDEEERVELPWLEVERRKIIDKWIDI